MTEPWDELKTRYHGQHSRMETLRPCPFCGSRQDMGGPEPEPGWGVIVVHAVNNRFVLCQDCGARSSEYPKTEAEAIERWNRRFRPGPAQDPSAAEGG